MSIERTILETYRTIVVVGASSIQSKPSHWVSQYMRRQGYTIIPVNPDETEVFGVPCYPDLASVPEPVEFVNVFRQPQYCADVVREAIAVGGEGGVAAIGHPQRGGTGAGGGSRADVCAEPLRAPGASTPPALAGDAAVNGRRAVPRRADPPRPVQLVQTPEPERHEGAITEPLESQPPPEPPKRDSLPPEPALSPPHEESERHEGAITERDEGQVLTPARSP